jgi:hypothetical protein
MIERWNIDSAIVGYWRCGATFNEIAELMNLSIEYVINVIDEFKINNYESTTTIWGSAN